MFETPALECQAPPAQGELTQLLTEALSPRRASFVKTREHSRWIHSGSLVKPLFQEAKPATQQWPDSETKRRGETRAAGCSAAGGGRAVAAAGHAGSAMHVVDYRFNVCVCVSLSLKTRPLLDGTWPFG